MKSDDFVVCPHCGEEIKKSARACPHCGSDEHTGWSEQTYLDGIDLPGDDAYEEIRQNEFGGRLVTPLRRRPWVYITAVIVLALFALGIMSALR